MNTMNQQKMNMNTKKSKGFTLVELLVVIAIIAGLAAVSTPVIIKVKEKAKKVSAINACKAVEVAVNAFENDYNYLPFVGSSPSGDNTSGLESHRDIMNVLTGLDEQVNFKRKAYFEYNEAKGGAGSYFDGLHLVASQARLFDPWGNPYLLFFDYDLDGAIDNPQEAGETINGKLVAVYTEGPDQKTGSAKKNRDNAGNF